MAEESIPVPSLTQASEEAAVAPNSFGGWSFFQRQVNVVLPLRLREAEQLLAHADRVLAGQG